MANDFNGLRVVAFESRRAKEIEKFLGPQGKAAPLSNLRMVDVMDVGRNLKEVVRNFGAGDVGPGGLALRAFQLKHISAEEAEAIVRDLFGLPQRGAATNVSSATSSSQRPSGPRFCRTSSSASRIRSSHATSARRRYSRARRAS